MYIGPWLSWWHRLSHVSVFQWRGVTQGVYVSCWSTA